MSTPPRLLSCAFSLAFSLLFCLAAAPDSRAADAKYVVQKSDTAAGIARKHGISLAALLRHNGLSQPNRIHPGDVLRIPSPRKQSPTATPASSIQKRLEQIPVTAGKWKFIVIHHSATSAGSAKGMDRYHREEIHMENGLAYHFVIGNGHGMGNGEITIGNRWIEQIQGGHLASEALNEKSIGICLVGNFDQDRPTSEQLASLQWLISSLMDRCHLGSSSLKTHRQIHPNHTACPGRNFPSEKFLKQFRASK
jgi:hypothetical protein